MAQDTTPPFQVLVNLGLQGDNPSPSMPSPLPENNESDSVLVWNEVTGKIERTSKSGIEAGGITPTLQNVMNQGSTAIVSTPFSVQSFEDITLNSTNGSLGLTGGGYSLLMSAANDAVKLTGGSGFHGFQYNADYGANQTSDRDVPDIGKVKSLIASESTSGQPLTYALTNFKYKAEQLQNGVTGISLVLGFFGDSWTQSVPGAIYYVKDLSKQLRSIYGNGGGGFYDFSRSSTVDFMRCADPDDAGDTRSGSITYKDQTADSKGVNIAHAEFNSGSKINLSVNTPHEKFVIHYFGGATYGTFRYRIDGGSWVSVNASATTGHQVIDEVVADAAHLIEFEVLSGTVILFGVDMQRTTGIRIHKLGNRGLRAYNINAVDITTWKQAVSSLGMDSMTVLLGTNDRTDNRTPAELKADIKKIVDEALLATPYMDIAIIGASENRETGKTYSMKQYNAELYALAFQYQKPFIDLRPLFGERAQIISKGTFFDNVHPTEVGGQMIGTYLYDNLFFYQDEGAPDGVLTVSGTTNEITVTGTDSDPVVGISSAYTSARDAYADAKVVNDLNDSTSVAPSKRAVTTALDLKANDADVVKLTGNQLIGGTKTFTTRPIVGTATAGTNDTSAASTAYAEATANAKVTQTITSGVTATAPSENTVFNAVALKANLNEVVNTTGNQTGLAGDKAWTGVHSFRTNVSTFFNVTRWSAVVNNTTVAAMQVVGETTLNMINGFGSGFVIAIKDDTAGPNPIVSYRGVRANSSDTTGSARIATYNSNVATEWFEVGYNGIIKPINGGTMEVPTPTIGAQAANKDYVDTTKVSFVGASDIEITDATKGVILRSPNGTRYRITVSDAGVLTTTSI